MTRMHVDEVASVGAELENEDAAVELYPSTQVEEISMAVQESSTIQIADISDRFEDIDMGVSDDSGTVQIELSDSTSGASFVVDGEVVVRVIGDYPIYDGSYSVVPKVENSVVLPTNGKAMTDDVTVAAIPQFTVSNLSGGYTLIIGEESMLNG